MFPPLFEKCEEASCCLGFARTMDNWSSGFAEADIDDEFDEDFL